MFGVNDLLLKNEKLSEFSATNFNDGVFTLPSIKLRVAQVLRMQGYKDLSRVHPKILSVAEETISLAQEVFQPTVHFRRVGVKNLSGEVLILDNGATFCSKAFGKYLSQSTEVAVCVMTLGSDLDEVEREMVKSEKLLETVFLETAGWLGIEQLTKLFSVRLREMVSSDGLTVGRRMSPGYTFRIEGKMHSWPLEDQKQLFDLFHKEGLSVELLESCAMSPKMSRSGLYGLLREKKMQNQHK